MTDRLQDLAARESQVRTKIASLLDEDIAAVLTGADPAHSDEINRLTQDLNTIQTAIDRLRDAA